MSTLRLLLVFSLVSASALAAHPSRDRASEPIALEKKSSARTALLDVEGVRCGACSLRIRKALKKLDGVEAVRAGKSKKRVLVDYDSKKTSPSQIAARVEKTGFGCRVAGDRGR